MTSMGLLGAILLGLVLLPVLLKWLQKSFPLIRDRLAAVVPGTGDLTRRAFLWAGGLLTDEGRLSPPDAVAQVAGAVLMMASGVIFALCDLQLTLATLGPIFGVESTGEIFGGFDQLLGLSLVLLAVVYGLILTDLLGWTFTTRFAVIERARVGAFCVALLCFVSSIVVTVALAAYRLPALMMDESAMSVEEAAAWIQSLPAIILLTLAVLLFLGVAFSFMSYDTFFSALMALCVAVGGLALGAVYVVLGMVDLVMEVALAGVTTLREATEPITNSFGEAAHGIKAGVSRGGSALWTKLGDLVAPRKAAVTVKAAGGEPLESPS